MTVLSGSIAFVLLMATAQVHGQQPAPASCQTSEQSVREADLRIWRAFHDRDLAALDRLIADDFIGIDDDGSPMTKKAAFASVKRPEAGPHEATAEKPEDLRIVFANGVAIVGFTRRSTIYDPAAEISWSVTSAMMRVLTCTSGEWKMVARTEVMFPNKERQPVTIPADRLDEDVGRYRFGERGEKGELVITRVGETLHETWAGEEPTELLPGKYDTFFARGDDWVESFIRDKSGKVIGILDTLTDGQMEAKRVP